MNKFKVDQTYYPHPLLKYEGKYLIYEIEDLVYSYNSLNEKLVINYILNIPLKYLSNNIKIKSFHLNSEIKLFYSIYDEYLPKYLDNESIKYLKKTNVSYLGKDVKFFPKYIIECINDKNVSIEFKTVLVALINCKKLDIEKRLELYNKISLIHINLGNILLKLSKYDDNSLNKDSVTFSSIYEII